MSSNIFIKKDNCRPFLAELEVIIRKTVPKSEENELRILMNNLEYSVVEILETKSYGRQVETPKISIN